MPVLKDISGERRGRLLVLKRAEGNDKHNCTRYHVRCDCGTEKVITRGRLRVTRSCGCLQREYAQLMSVIGNEVVTRRRIHKSREIAAQTHATGMKACRRAKCPQQNPQPIASFNKCKKAIDGLSYFCKTCQSDKYLGRSYGTSTAHKSDMIRLQGFKCANHGCAKEISSNRAGHLDHCHATGAIRGILCGSCNKALGLLRDSPESISGLLAYAMRHRQLRCA